jgi:hypothetical protein
LSLILTNNRSLAPGIRRRTLSSRVQIGTVTLTFVIIALALAVSLIYLAHANRTATRGYIIRRLETEKNVIQTQNEIWEQKVSEAKSLGAIKNSKIVAEMKPVREANYIRAEKEIARR